MTPHNPVLSVILPVMPDRLAHAQWVLRDYANQDAPDVPHELVITTRDSEVARFLGRLCADSGWRNVSVVVPSVSVRIDSLLIAAQLRAAGVFLALWTDAGRYGPSWVARSFAAIAGQTSPLSSVVVPAEVLIDLPDRGLVYCGEETTIPRMVEAVPAVAASGNRPGRPAQMSLEGPGMIFPSLPCVFARASAPAWGTIGATTIPQLVQGLVAGTSTHVDRVVPMPGAPMTILAPTGPDDEVLRALAYRRGSAVVGSLKALPDLPKDRDVLTLSDGQFTPAGTVPAAALPAGLPDLT